MTTHLGEDGRAGRVDLRHRADRAEAVTIGGTAGDQRHGGEHEDGHGDDGGGQGHAGDDTWQRQPEMAQHRRSGK